MIWLVLMVNLMEFQKSMLRMETTIFNRLMDSLWRGHPQRPEYWDAYISDDFPHKLKHGQSVYRINPLTKQPTDQMIKPSRKQFENIKSTFSVNQDRVLYPVTPMPDAIRGKVSINKLFTNSIFNLIWNRIKNEVHLDNLTSSPVEFYQYHKTRMWNLFKQQILSNSNVPKWALRSRAGFDKFLKSDPK
jgi:hypothetical protein